jgi:hypothetical protein
MSERERALEAALRMLRNSSHAIMAMSYDAIKDSAGYTNLKVWIARVEEADALFAEAPAEGVSPQPDEQYRKTLNVLGNFYAMVRGESPSLLEDDGNAFAAWSVLDDAKWFDSPEPSPATVYSCE